MRVAIDCIIQSVPMYYHWGTFWGLHLVSSPDHTLYASSERGSGVIRRFSWAWSKYHCTKTGGSNLIGHCFIGHCHFGHTLQRSRNAMQCNVFLRCNVYIDFRSQPTLSQWGWVITRLSQSKQKFIAILEWSCPLMWCYNGGCRGR